MNDDDALFETMIQNHSLKDVCEFIIARDEVRRIPAPPPAVVDPDETPRNNSTMRCPAGHVVEAA